MIHKGIEYYSNLLHDKKKIREMTPSKKSTLQRKLQILSDFTKLNVYSWVGLFFVARKMCFVERRAI